MSKEEQEAATAFIREVWGLQGAAYLVLGVRYYHQISNFRQRGIHPDDIVMFIATVSYYQVRGIALAPLPGPQSVL